MSGVATDTLTATPSSMPTPAGGTPGLPATAGSTSGAENEPAP
jgi:hypothetical protein